MDARSFDPAGVGTAPWGESLGLPRISNVLQDVLPWVFLFLQNVLMRGARLKLVARLPRKLQGNDLGLYVLSRDRTYFTEIPWATGLRYPLVEVCRLARWPDEFLAASATI